MYWWASIGQAPPRFARPIPFPAPEDFWFFFPAPQNFPFLLLSVEGVGSRLGDSKQPVTFGANVRPPSYVC